MFNKVLILGNELLLINVYDQLFSCLIELKLRLNSLEKGIIPRFGLDFLYPGNAFYNLILILLSFSGNIFPPI